MPMPLENIAEMVKTAVTEDAVELARVEIERLDKIGLEDVVPDGFEQTSQYEIDGELDGDA